MHFDYSDLECVCPQSFSMGLLEPQNSHKNVLWDIPKINGFGVKE